LRSRSSSRFFHRRQISSSGFMVLYNFGFQDYLAFLAVLAVIYVAVFNYAQGKIGGARNMRALQAEMRDVQKGMTDAAKSKDEKALNAAIDRNWKMTMELLVLQMKLMVVILGIFIPLSLFFPLVEPGTNDDIRMIMADDGLVSHCDSIANDSTYSACLSIPANATIGAWTVDAHLLSPQNESLSRNATALFCKGGVPEDVWLQASTQSGLFDVMTGKKQYSLNITGTKACEPGGAVLLQSHASALPQGARIEAVANSGTFFYLDLPITIPLINIRRIIGSYGIFIFLVFVASMAYGLAKSAYLELKKRMEIKKI
jgi:hypothetical protein